MRLKRSIITAVATAGLLTAGSCGGDDPAAGGPTTQQTGAPEVGYQCPESASQPAVDGPVQVTKLGVCSYHDGLGRVTYGVVVQNTGDEAVHEVSVDVDVHDTAPVNAGRAVPHFIFELEPGQEIGIGYYSLVEGTPEGSVLSVQIDYPEATDDGARWADGEMSTSNVVTTVEGGGRTTSFTLASTYDFPRDSVEVFVVYYDAAGVVVGGEADLVGHIDAQGTVTHVVTSDYVNPAVTEAAVYVNDNPERPRS